MATYVFSIGGVEKTVQPGWTIDATANGVDTLRCSVLSLDGSYRPALDAVLHLYEHVVLVTSSVASPSIITTAEPHGVVSGMTVGIQNHVGGTPDINAYHVATRIDATSFSIPVNVTVGGTGGTVSRRIFGGTITTPREAGLGGRGVTPILTFIEADDYNAQAGRRILNTTLVASKLNVMLATICTALGWTIHPGQVEGPDVSAIPCDYAKAEDVLNKIATLTGYVWEFDPHDRLRMFLPNTETCPVAVVDGNGVAIGDIIIAPTRTNYANKIILRYSWEAAWAMAFMVISPASSQFHDGDTVTIGGTTYTFKSTLTDTPGYVHIGATLDESLTWLGDAMSLSAGAGTNYAASTLMNTQADGGRAGDSLFRANARTIGAAGNSVGVSQSSAHATWPGGANLAGGADRELAAVAIAENLTEQAAHGAWEQVVQSADTTLLSDAETLAAAVLAARIVTPRTMTYGTYALGIWPGQKQTNTVATRDVTAATFLVTDVKTKNTKGNLVFRTVTAIESLVLDTVARWRDDWKQMTGAVGGSASSVGGINVGSSGVSIISFGGAENDWQQTSAGGWTDANSIEVVLDPTTRGSATGTMYVRIRAMAGSVAARLRDKTNGATVGTSAAVTSTSFVTVAFAVSLTATPATYGVQLSPSVADTDVGLGSAYLE